MCDHVCNISMYLLSLPSYATRKYAKKLRLKPNFVKALDIHPKAQPSIAAFGPGHWSKWILVILSSRAWDIRLFWRKNVILMGFRCPELGVDMTHDDMMSGNAVVLYVPLTLSSSNMPVLFSLEANIWLRNKRQKKKYQPCYSTLL